MVVNLRIIERLKSWQVREDAKRKAMKERLEHMEPFREQMLRRMIIATLIFQPIQAVLALHVRTDLKWVAGLIGPAIALLVALSCLYLTKRRWRIGMATSMLFLAISFPATWMQGGMIEMGMHGFPQYGGVLILTIVLSGLLIGEFFVRIWTIICCLSFQLAINQANGAAFNLGWCAVYIACGFQVSALHQ